MQSFKKREKDPGRLPRWSLVLFGIAAFSLLVMLAYIFFEMPAVRVLLLIPPAIALLNNFFGFNRLITE